MSIFTDEKHKKEFVAAFRKLTASGAVTKDAAIEKLIRNNPNYFHQLTPDDIAKISRSEMNAEIRRRAQQPNKLTIDLFCQHPTDRQNPLITAEQPPNHPSPKKAVSVKNLRLFP
jgi:hypothetical protein